MILLSEKACYLGEFVKKYKGSHVTVLKIYLIKILWLIYKIVNFKIESYFTCWCLLEKLTFCPHKRGQMSNVIVSCMINNLDKFHFSDDFCDCFVIRSKCTEFQTFRSVVNTWILHCVENKTNQYTEVSA